MPFQTQPLIYTRYSQALAFTNNGRNQLSYVLAHSAPGTDPARVARHIEQRTGLQANTAEAFAWKTMMYFLRNTGIPVNFGTVVALGVVVGIAVVGLTFHMFVTENLKQYAALKAMGKKPRLARRPNKHHPVLAPRLQRYNRLIARRRAAVETTFATLKRRMGLTAIRYIGLSKAEAQVMLAAMAFNLRRWVTLSQAQTA